MFIIVVGILQIGPGWSSGENDFVITYTLDNYITIDGKINGKYQYEHGHLIALGDQNNTKGRVYEDNNSNLVFDGIKFSQNSSNADYAGETLQEYIGNDLYYYAKINGTKYYYYNYEDNPNAYSDIDSTSPNDYIFFIAEDGTEKRQVNSKRENLNEFKKYYNAIFQNLYGYRYYQDAYEFTKKVLEDFNLKNLKVTDTFEYKSAQNDQERAKVLEKYTTSGNIFDGLIQESDSNFNHHRSQVIRNVIETSLQTSISAYKNYSRATEVDFIMPKISETDWELLENNICMATFMQGMSIGGKVYNSYSVVQNNLNKEHVDENDIYILTSNGEYTRANDNNLLDGTSTIFEKNMLGYYPGVLNINFENKVDARSGTTIYYNPLRDKNNGGTPYYASYTGMIGSSSLNDITYSDMYKYMRGDMKYSNGNSIIVNTNVKRAYYLALGRERYSAYNVNNEMKYLLPDVQISKEQEPEPETIPTESDETTEPKTNIDELHIGDYVDYKYYGDESYNLQSSESGYTYDQTITRTSNLKWRILNIYDDNSLNLISEDMGSSKAFSFNNNLGRVNSLNLLSTMANKLFVNLSYSDKFKGRSLSIEDVEKFYKQTLIDARNNNEIGIGYGNKKKYAGAEYLQTAYRIDKIEEAYFENSNVYEMLFNTGKDYFLASPCINCWEDDVNFGIFWIQSKSINDVPLYSLMSNSGMHNAGQAYLRPIIHIDPSVEINVKGGTENDMHEIVVE